MYAELDAIYDQINHIQSGGGSTFLKEINFTMYGFEQETAFLLKRWLKRPFSVEIINS